MTLRQSQPPRAPTSAKRLPGLGATTLPYAVGAVAALAASALVNHRLAKRAERENPPKGGFLHVDGVRLHYLDRGEGEPLVLLHGNGSMVEDFVSSGLFDRAARARRVIAFDRPGFGHSERPRGTIWSPEAQADLIAAALDRLGVSRAVVLGHSWGCAVAVALAQRRPDLVGRLVLASGYYYPSARADVVGMSLPAVPILGDVLRYTVVPLVSRAIWPLLMRKVFGPAIVPQKFEGFPKEMAVRPSQIRASAAESALMIPSAVRAAPYAGLTMPVAIIAGDADRVIDARAQSARLHAEVSQSTLDLVPGAGHMVHQTATGVVLALIDRGGALGKSGPKTAPLAA